MILACPSLMCSYRVMLKGLALQKIVVDFFCIHVLLYVCAGVEFVA